MAYRLERLTADGWSADITDLSQLNWFATLNEASAALTGLELAGLAGPWRVSPATPTYPTTTDDLRPLDYALRGCHADTIDSPWVLDRLPTPADCDPLGRVAIPAATPHLSYVTHDLITMDRYGALTSPWKPLSCAA